MLKFLIFNKNFVFKKFLNFYSYKISIFFSNNNLYCFLNSFFNFNILISLSTISLFLRNYILLNFGKNLNCYVCEFLGKCFSIFLLNLKIFKFRFKIFKFNKKIKFFFSSIKKYIFF